MATIIITKKEIIISIIINLIILFPPYNLRCCCQKKAYFYTPVRVPSSNLPDKLHCVKWPIYKHCNCSHYVALNAGQIVDDESNNVFRNCLDWLKTTTNLSKWATFWPRFQHNPPSLHIQYRVQTTQGRKTVTQEV
jgi:hypothetical protein